MAVTNIDKVYFCCLYGNTEDEVIIRSIERDLNYEELIIAFEEDFWVNNVLKKVPPPYSEDGDLVLESIKKHPGMPIIKQKSPKKQPSKPRLKEKKPLKRKKPSERRNLTLKRRLAMKKFRSNGK